MALGIYLGKMPFVVSAYAHCFLSLSIPKLFVFGHFMTPCFLFRSTKLLRLNEVWPNLDLTQHLYGRLTLPLMPVRRQRFVSAVLFE